MSRIRVIHWKPSEAGAILDACRAAGHTAEIDETADAHAVGRAVKANPPDAILIDLTRLPSHGREFAIWLRGSRKTRFIPLIFVGGDPLKVKGVRTKLPDAVYAEVAELSGAIGKALRTPVREPIVPASMMERGSAKATADKLGIVRGSTVAVIEAPRDYVTVLGNLPDAAQIEEDADTVAEVTLWFLESEEALFSGLRRMRALAPKTKLWLAWRKGRKTGLTGNVIRAAAAEAGLVDYKICSLNTCWSAMAFARRKAA